MSCLPCLDHLSRDDYADVYEPSEDTFLFIDALDKELTRIADAKPTRILEMGPGSGCISVHLLQQLQKRAVQCLPSCLLIDINPKAVTAALKTAACNGVGQHFDGLQGDLFRAIRPRQTFDMMLFNPPYVPSPAEEMCEGGIAAAWAGGVDGREVIDRFIQQAPDHLADGGCIYLLSERRNKPEEIRQLFKQKGFCSEEVLHRRAQNELLNVTRFWRVGWGESACDVNS
mmetsp:Transcript_32643/g.80813  ORF Transcript_32643/g.80813 Transcript_32643/m.80813 type:complete len:229 (-) Transcript_32643:298-984(-)